MPAGAQTSKILLIDSDEFQLDRLKENLRTSGYMVWATGNITEAQALLKDDLGFHFLIVNFELAQQSQDYFEAELPSNILSIVLLDEANFGNTLEGMQVYAYITQPVNLSKLKSLLDIDLEQQTRKVEQQDHGSYRTVKQVEDGLKQHISAPLDQIASILAQAEGDLVGEDVQRLKEEFAKAKYTLERLKGFSEEDSLEPLTEMTIQELLLEAANDSQLTDKVELEWVIPNTKLKVQEQRDKIKTAFVELFKNANEAMNGQGLLHIEVQEANAKIKIIIIDQGKGLDYQTRQKVFDPFFSSKNKTGLGLNLALNHIQSLNGKLMVTESIPNQGTTILIELPLIE